MLDCCDVCPIAEAAYRGLAPVWPSVYWQRTLEVTSESRKGSTKMPSRSRATPKSSSVAEDGEVQRDTPTSTTVCLHQSTFRCADRAKGGSTGTPAKRKGHLNGGARTVEEQVGGDISRAEQDGKTEP